MKKPNHPILNFNITSSTNIITVTLLIALAISILINTYLFYTTNKHEAYSLRKLNNYEYSIFDEHNNQDVARLIDKDQDGKVDYIYQRITDNKGAHLRDTIDYDLDGYPDIRVEMDGSGGFAWYEGGWYHINYNKQDDTRHITKDRVSILLTEENSPFIKWHKKLFGQLSK
jgi:lipopolysaccharide export LptBFGC system permease protein LptF